MNMNGFRCFRCNTTQSPTFTGFQCPECGGNLEITYPYRDIGNRLQGRFDSDRPDIFRYLPLLPLESDRSAPPLRVGGTPLYSAEHLGAPAGLPHLLLKDEGLNPSASFKDRASAVAIARAAEIGAPLTAGASTGNAGSSMACMSAAAHLPCVIFVPEKAPVAKLTQLLIFGARVIAVRGTYDDAFDLCMQVCERHGWFNRNTGFNPFTREGKKTCSFELWEQLHGELPDWVVVPVGDGNIISGIWKGFRELRETGLAAKTPRILCAQSECSSAITQTIRKIGRSAVNDWSRITVENVRATTIADSISVDIPRDGLAAVRAVLESDGAAVTVPDAAILDALSELARQAGVFSEPAAATAWACAKQAAASGLIKKEERVVCLLTGNGLKDVASARKIVNDPCVIDPDPEAAEAALADLTAGA